MITQRMNLYIWQWLGGMTDNWHSGAGVGVVALTIERARELFAAEAKGREKDRTDWDSDPDAIYEIAGIAEEKIFVFPDAGCC